MMEVSRFGKKMAIQSGIGQLMDDLGAAPQAPGEILMLGGGNPAHIAEVQRHFRASMMALLDSGDRFERALGDYDPPEGNTEFIRAVSELLREQLGWAIGPRNIALTNGSQSAFFVLFNLFAGEGERGVKKVLFPLTPEYIGYCNVGLAPGLFTARKPRIEHVDEHIFKYHIDFDRLEVTDDIGAICVSRPTNPSGNVLTNEELERLSAAAKANGVPLIVDNAYGLPFPHIVFTDAEPLWDENTIVCMSLSKLGLPGTRTGIIIAHEEVIEMVARVNAVMNLAPGGMGATLAAELVRSGQILRISREVVGPFYQAKASKALAQFQQHLEGVPYRIHQPEGAFFLWLWLPDLPITSQQLYERLKARNVIVVSGHHFFPGLDEPWTHRDECLRVSYAQSDDVVARGVQIIAEEVKRAYDAGKAS